MTDAAQPTKVRGAHSTYEKYRRLAPWAVGVSLATLAAISIYYQSQRGADILGDLRTLKLWTIPAAIGLHLVMQVFWALRLRTLGAGLGAPVTTRRALMLVTSGLFAAAVTPGRVGGEPWRIAMLYRGGATGAAASRTIFADRAVDIIYFLVLGFITVLALPRLFGDTGNVQGLGFTALAGLVTMVVILVLMLVSPKPMSRLLSMFANVPARIRRRPTANYAPAIRRFFHEISEGILALARHQPWRLAVGAVLSVALWTCELSILWVVLHGFGFSASYSSVYLAGILVVMIGSVPFLPGGSGLAEVAALTLLTPLAPGLTAAFLLVWRGLTYYVDLTLGAIVAGIIARSPRPSSSASAQA